MKTMKCDLCEVTAEGETFEEWIKENTSGVLIMQIRDRSPGGWDSPYISDDISDHVTSRTPWKRWAYNPV